MPHPCEDAELLALLLVLTSIMTITNRSNRLIAFAGGVAVALALMGSVAVAPAQAASLSSAQISAIVGLLQSFGADSATIANVTAALSGQATPGTGAACPVLTRSLSLGATGADVQSLQKFLNANAATRVAVSGAGSPGLETMYFGPATQSAVIKFQAANNVSAIGVVGPATRAAIAAVCGTTPTPTPAPTPTPTPTRGDEGQLKNFSTIGGGVESEVQERQKDIKVLGVEFDADDSDMRINRVDVEFSKASGAGSNRLERYISSVSLWLGDKRLASQTVSRSNRDNDTYEFRFSGLSGLVREGDEGKLYVAVDAVQNIDSADLNTQWEVTIPSDGIRAVDEAGISDTYGGQDLSETFSFGEQTVGTLRLSAANDNPEDDIVVVSDDKDTKNVTLLKFELRARNQDIEIADLPVSLGITGNASQLTDIVRTVKLMQGTKEIKSKSIPSSAGTYAQVVFDNVDLMVDEGDTETYSIVADIHKLDGDFEEGDSLVASTTASLSGWDIEDAQGEDVNPTGSVTGGTLNFFVNGIQAKFGSATAERRNASVAGDADSVDFTIKFSVTAIGDEDIYLDGDVVQGVVAPTTATAGLSWATTTDSTSGTGEYTALLTPDNGYRSDDTNAAGDKRLKIESGQTRNFTFKVSIPAEDDNVNLGVRITGLKWDTTNQDNMTRLYNFNLSSFTTQTVTGLFVR